MKLLRLYHVVAEKINNFIDIGDLLKLVNLHVEAVGLYHKKVIYHHISSVY